MEKKLFEINEAFEHLRFSDCLATIDQLVKKYSKPDKKKQTLSERELTVVKCFRAGALVSLGRYHEAHSAYQEVITPNSLALIGEDYTYLLTSVAELFGESREAKMMVMLEKHSPKYKKETLFRFYLSSKMFSGLSKLFLKEFMTSKNMMMQFGQVYLEYLQCLDKAGLIAYRRDGWYKFSGSLKMGLKMVSMFLEKCIKSANEGVLKGEKDLKEGNFQVQANAPKAIEQCKTVLKQSNILKLKIAINEGRVLDAIKMFQQLRAELKFPFTFIRSILKLKDEEVSQEEEKEAVNRFYVEEMSLVFRTNLDFKQYTPWYDYYNEFLWQLIARAEKTDPSLKQNLVITEQRLPLQQLYKFNSSSPAQILTLYSRSLSTNYLTLTDPTHEAYSQSKISDYYKICLKGLLLQLLQINFSFSSCANLTKYLQEYTRLFVNTLTFASEMKTYWKLLISEKIVSRKEGKVENDSQLIEEINFHKISLGVENQVSYEGFMACYQELSGLYKVRVSQVQKNRKLQKGERYISDEFFTLISDYARAYIQTKTSSKQIQEVTSLMISELEWVVEVSPYNGDTKLRLIHFCSLLNHHERMIEIFFSNDIKSVQWETLGFWFIRTAIEFGVGQNYDQQMDKCVRSYQENQRETSEYGLKALKAGQVEQVDQYLCYRDTILKSYNSVVLLYCLFQKYRFEGHSEFYLLAICERIRQARAGERELCLNADFRVMGNEMFQGLGFGDFYGIFNNSEVLEMEVQVYLQEQVVIQKLLDKDNQTLGKDLLPLPKLEQTIASFEVGKIFDFKGYTFQQDKPAFDCQTSKYTVVRNAAFLKHFALVSQLRISVVLMVEQLHGLIKKQEVSKELLEQLKGKVLEAVKALEIGFRDSEYRFQLHGITLIRRGLFESYNLLSLVREVVQKNKKLKFAKESVNSMTEGSLELLFTTIVTLKWSQAPECSLKLLQSRDEGTQRGLSMDVQQAKRMISRYQSSYKW